MRYCWECGIENVPFNKHHPIPVSRGGKRTILLCEPCHSKAHHAKNNMNISALTKEALRKKKAQGFKLGSPDIKKAQKAARLANKSKANDFALGLKDLIGGLDKAGINSYRQKAIHLNSIQVPTRQGNQWTASGMRRLCLRLKELERKKESND